MVWASAPLGQGSLVSQRQKRASLSPREAALCHEALWMLEGTDQAWQTAEVRALIDKLDRYAAPPLDVVSRA